MRSSSNSAIYFDHIVLGGGIVGLAIASQFSKRSSSSSTLLLERRPHLLSETSSHNSGVVHSGLYYPRESLKTKLCIEGNKWIWNRQCGGSNKCSSNVPLVDARKCGKWIIASTDQEAQKLLTLQLALQDRGMPFRWVSKKERLQKEPELDCIGECLESCDSGVVDVHSLANCFQREFETSGSNNGSATNNNVILTNTEPKSFRLVENSNSTRIQLILNDANETVVETACLVNSTGLFASKVAAKIRQETINGESAVLPDYMIQKLVRGSYVSVTSSSSSSSSSSGGASEKKHLLSRLIYPCPLENLAGLGVHSVIDTATPPSASTLLFGPNVEFLTENEQDQLLANDASRYKLSATSTDDAFLDSVHAAVSKYLPRLDRRKLQPAFCGIRPKLSGKGESFRDFLFEVDKEVDKATRGEVKVVHCLGIESPGLTSSPAIGRYVVEEVLKK